VVVDKWPLLGFKPFYPMALDAANHRLFIGSRNPAKLVVLDTASGKIVTSAEGVGHTDDLWYDAVRKRIYMSGGDKGSEFLSSADHYPLIAKIPSVPGASTSFSPRTSIGFTFRPHRTEANRPQRKCLRSSLDLDQNRNRIDSCRRLDG
jgi:hypothetical protein